jgi:DNA-binding transcriptional ArsR family regulator
MVDAQKRLAELETVFAALAHPARRQVLLVVWFRGGAMSAGEIAGRFSHSWPTTSRHLRVLIEAGLLRFEKRGRTRVYRVDDRKLQVVRDWLAWFERTPDRGRRAVAPHVQTQRTPMTKTKTKTKSKRKERSYR